MKYFLAFLMCYSFQFCLLGQKTLSNEWNIGTLILEKGDTINGMIRYNMETNIVEIIENNAVTSTAYTCKKLLYFKLHEPNRQFYALPFALNYNYKTPIIFEMLKWGNPISLLCREHLEYKMASDLQSIGFYSLRKLELVYTYYLIDDKGKITELRGSKKNIYRYFIKKTKEINDFIKKNKLNYMKRNDLYEIVQYYNSLL